MAVVLIDETTLTGIANSIRTKLNTQATYKPGDMAAAISSISGGGSATLGTKTITSNATYNASSDNLDGYSSVTVNVPTGTAKSSSDLTANNLTVTAPAGLYSSDASKTLTDANLTAGNIKKDVTIFGVTGSYEGGGGGGASYATGTFTPSSNITSKSFDIGDSSYNHFILYAAENSDSQGVRALRAVICDFSKTNSNLLVFMTNNSGAGVTGSYYTTGWVTKSGSTVTYNNSSNYLPANIPYTWIAW